MHGFGIVWTTLHALDMSSISNSISMATRKTIALEQSRLTSMWHCALSTFIVLTFRGIGTQDLENNLIG